MGVGKRLGLGAGLLALMTAHPCAAQDKSDFYLLTGQSNMSGRGLVSELTEAERAPDPEIRLFANDGRWRVAVDPLDDPAGQVDAVSADTQAAVGPGLFFARAMHKSRLRPVSVAPCAKGGSSIGRWKPAEGRDTLYGSCLARAREAALGVTGIVWYQGETDAEKPDNAKVWTESFIQLAAQFRKDLGKPNLPVVLVQLADAPPQTPGARPYPSWTAIQDAQGGDFGRCVAMVSAKGLPLKEDGLHLTTASQRIVGERLAVAMTGLLARGCG